MADQEARATDSAELDDIDCFRAVRDAIRNRRWRLYVGLLTESEVLERLDGMGLPLVRSLENARCDAALLIQKPGTVLANFDMPRDPQGRRAWLRRQQQSDARYCIEVDVKYRSVEVSHERDPQRGRGPPRSTVGPYQTQMIAELVIVVVETIQGYHAWVPGVIYTDSTHVQALDLGAGFLHPFMIEDGDAPEAYQRLLGAVEDPGVRPYCNPTTQSCISGWRPRVTAYPRIEPLHSDRTWRTAVGAKAVESMCERFVAASGATICDNPVQPLVCDLLLQLPGLPPGVPFVLIECKGHGESGFMWSTGTRSPFHEHRHIHFLIAWHWVSDTYLCIPRHKMRVEWADQMTIHSDIRAQFRFQGSQAIPDMLQYLRDNAAAAVLAADSALRSALSVTQDPPASKGALKGNVAAPEPTRPIRSTSGNSSATSATAEHVPSTPGVRFRSDGPSPQARRRRDMGLSWLHRHLNLLCMRAGSMLCFALHGRHPWATHVLVRHQWTKADIAAFEKDVMPHPLFAKILSDRVAILLRLWDMSGASLDGSSSNPSWPLWLDRRNTRSLATQQRFFIVGSTMPGKHAELSLSARSALLLPSGLTTFHEQPLRSSNPHLSRLVNYNIYRPEQYMPLKEFSGRRRAVTVALRKGSSCLQPHVDPVRYIVDAMPATSATSVTPSLFEELHRVLHADGISHFTALDLQRENQSFDPRPYQTTVREVIQAAITYGLD